MKMPGFSVSKDIFKDGIGYHERICPCCKLLLRDPVQLTCGHRICESCTSDTFGGINPKCPECKQEFRVKDGAQNLMYSLDVIVKEEINNLAVICPFSKAGCSWEGKFRKYEGHKNICPFKTDLITQEKPFFSISGDEQKDLTQLGSLSDDSGKKEVLTFPEMGCDLDGNSGTHTVQIPFKKSGMPVHFKGVDDKMLARHICPKCKLLLRDAVQPACGHRICQSCADEILAKEATPCCPECDENFENEDGAYYFPDRFARKEIKNLSTVCPFGEYGCSWEGKFERYQQHVEKCKYAVVSCEHCGEKVRGDQMEKHLASCSSVPRKCPLAIIGCNENSPMKRSDLQNHLQRTEESHLALLAGKIASLENHIKEKSVNLVPKYSLEVRRVNTTIHQDTMQEKQIQRTLAAELRSKDAEIASLKATLNKLEKTVRSKNAELEDRDFRLSLIENSNHDGSMIWKIPQFSQRKADASNGKYTSIFSLPFYSGRYGYKMCLRLYIMGDGIGKGTHLSLFFVVMRGEFDNILQWPFTHKVTFKLINQAGGRDIVDTFQPDPMSSSFRKPKSDMNIASGCPRFVSHTELERGGFVVDDTIFIKCIIDTSTIRHP